MRKIVYEMLLEDMESCGTWIGGDLIWKYGCTAKHPHNNMLGYGSVHIPKAEPRHAYVTRVVWHHFVDPTFPIWMKDSVDKKIIDHKCEDTRCFRLDHLYPETFRMNSILGRNSQLNRTKASRYPGVSRSQGTWIASLRIGGNKNGQHVNLGTFPTEEAAAAAYRQAMQDLRDMNMED